MLQFCYNYYTIHIITKLVIYVNLFFPFFSIFLIYLTILCNVTISKYEKKQQTFSCLLLLFGELIFKFLFEVCLKIFYINSFLLHCISVTNSYCTVFF